MYLCMHVLVYVCGTEVLLNTECFGHRQLPRCGMVGKLKKRSSPPQQHTFLCKDQPNKTHSIFPLSDCDGGTHNSSSSPRTHVVPTTLLATDNEHDSEVGSASNTSTVSRTDSCLETWLVLKRGIKGLKNVRINC